MSSKHRGSAIFFLCVEEERNPDLDGQEVNGRKKGSAHMDGNQGTCILQFQNQCL